MSKHTLIVLLTVMLMGCGANTVKVVNRPDRPVPITGGVEITNTPNVIVGNTARNPVPVVMSDANTNAREPFQSVQWSALSESSKQVVLGFRVPDDNILVIETITARVRLNEGDQVGEIMVRTVVKDRACDHNLPVFVQGTSDGYTHFIGAHPVRLYAYPGSRVNSYYSRSPNGGNYYFRTSVSGYLIPKGSPSLAP